MQERYVGYQRVKIHGVYAGKNERNGVAQFSPFCNVSSSLNDICITKIIRILYWAELVLGRLGSRPSWYGPTWQWADLTREQIIYLPEGKRDGHFGCGLRNATAAGVVHLC